MLTDWAAARCGGLGDRGSHGSTIRREGVKLLLTGGGDLRVRAAPGKGSCGAGLFDEGDAIPQAAHICAAYFVGAAEGVLHDIPVVFELL